jgi:hypothetical protein
MSDDTHNALRSDMATREAGLAFGKALNDWFVKHGPTAIYKTCATCQFMRQTGSALCEKYNATPPVSVIMTGCDEYRDIKLAGRPGYRPTMENFRQNSTLDEDIPF